MTHTEPTRVWPATLLEPATVAQADNATNALHEAAHAVIAADFGYTVEFIDVTRTASRADVAARGWAMGTSFDPAPVDEAAAVILAASRPAVTLYLHLLGIEARHPDAVDTSCRHDDEHLRYMCALQPELEAWVRDTAERWVAAQWGRIVHLAEQLTAAQGFLDRPDIPPAQGATNHRPART